MTTLERLPPHDIAAEEAVLASLMVDNDVALDVLPKLQAGDFFREKHALIYDAEAALAGRGEPINLVLLANELASRGQLEQIGGVAYLSQITTDLPTAVGAKFYAEIVARDAVYRRMVSAAGKIAQIGYDGGPDMRENLATAQALVTLLDREGPGKGVRSLAQIVAEKRGELEARAMDPTIGRGTPTGLRALDRLLAGGGLLPGKTYVVGGATSMGKSTFLRIILRNQALSGHHVALFTLEQDEDEVLEELAYGLASVDRQAHEAACMPLTPVEQTRFVSALDTLHCLDNLHIDDAAGLTTDDMRLRLARLCGKYPVKVVGVDYLHIIAPNRARKDNNREREVARMAEALRDTAKELNVALLLLSQLNRAVGDKERKNHSYRPRLGDFRDSGAVTHLPYAVIGLHRQDYYVEEGFIDPSGWVGPDGRERFKGDADAMPELDGLIEAHILKQQRGKRGVRALLRFRGNLSAIEDLEGDR